MPGEINGDNAVGEASDQLEDTYIKPIILSLALDISGAMYQLCLSYRSVQYTQQNVIDYSILLLGIEGEIKKIEDKNPSIKNLAIMEFLFSIAQNNKLHEELEILNNLALNSIDYEGFYSQLSKVVTDFKLQSLADKIRFLGLLKEKENFAATQKVYRDKWSFYDLMNDGGFKQACVNKAVDELDESVSEGFKKSMGSYIKSVDEGKKVASRHFEENIAFQAYCKETKEANKALNINLIHYDKSKPIKISDILQQEKDIGKLNIYCNKKRDICARRKDKKRYYEFKEGAYYQITSKWPIKDESGNISTCTMVMDVSNDGITKIVKFNGENFKSSSKEFWELIGQNEELHIQGSPLHEAVEKFLGMQHSREEMIRMENSGSSLPDVVAGSSSTPSTNNNASESTEEAATHTGGNPLLDDDVFFDCTEGLKGVVVGDDNHASCGSFPVSTTPPTTSRNTCPPGP
ncbi:MAG: hypothetical protein LBU02_00275 [Rickettsiales bacterium]|jgi:hypothetical protein|nr:hypothetical protein [Rickettsiales bacterium]